MSFTRMRRIEASAETVRRRRVRRESERFIAKIGYASGVRCPGTAFDAAACRGDRQQAAGARAAASRRTADSCLISRLEARCDRLHEKTEFDRLLQNRHRRYVGTERTIAEDDEAAVAVRDAAPHP